MTSTSHTGLSVHIATRESRLALAQSQQMAQTLHDRFGWQVGLLGMTTQGDQILDRALSQLGGKGVFVKELEQAMLDGKAQLAVHSLKDVPMSLPEGFILAAIPEREDPRDAFLSHKYPSLDALPQGAVIGTSSLRRQVLLHALRPDLKIEMLRGNLDTRLRKLDEGLYDAIVLAVAGLNRLKLQKRIRMAFDTQQMTPSAGQGALGIEVHQSQTELVRMIRTLNHVPTLLACTAERAVSRALGGNCSIPLAAHATWITPTQLQLSAAWGDVEKKSALIRVQETCALPHIEKISSISDNGELALAEKQAGQLGTLVANKLIAQGAVIPPTP